MPSLGSFKSTGVATPSVGVDNYFLMPGSSAKYGFVHVVISNVTTPGVGFPK